MIEADADSGLRDIDFDLLEVINPGGIDHEERLQAVRKDWLSFLLQGERIVAVANSDSHTAFSQVAIPRTMVAVNGDRVTAFNQAEFLTALKAGRAYGTTGPMLEVSLSGHGMGDTFTGERGQLSIEISAADWIPVDKVAIQVNGRTVAEHTITLTERRSTALLLPLEFDKDSFVTIEVSGPTTELYQTIYPEISPYAFSNPIYVDYDGDGKWQPPGL